MSLQSTNRVKVSKVREDTFGVTPANPVFKTRRIKSNAIAATPQTVVTEEIRDDRQVTDLILVGQQAGGQETGEASFRSMDDILEEALQGTWANTPERDNDGTADSVITGVATTNTEVTHLTGSAFVAGQLVLFSGFGIAGNNGLFKCSTGGATTSRYVGSGITNEAAPAAAARMKVVGFQGASGDLAAVTAGGNAITSTTLDFTTLGLAVGQWCRPAGFDTAADNGFCRISAIAAQRLSFDVVPDGWVADAGTGDVISVYVGDRLINASTQRSNTFERQYLDHSPVTYEYLRGLTLDKLSFQVDAQKVLTWTADYIGSDAVTDNSRVAGATDIAAPSYDVLNASSNVGRLGYNGGELAGPNFVMGAGFDISNNLRRQIAVGSIGAVGIGTGEFTVTGRLNTYFGDKSVLDSILANTRVSYDVAFGRSDGNKESLLFDFPAIKFSGGAPSVSGKNADVMIDGAFQAIMHPTLGYTMSVTRFWRLP